MKKFEKVKYVVVFTGVASLFIGLFKRHDTSDEPITKQCVTTVYDTKQSDSIYSFDTNYNKVMNGIENQFTWETLLESASYDTLNVSQKKDSSYKISTKSYVVNGQKYYPMAEVGEFTETGSASWYGPRFHGKKTASGDVYDQYKHTAAHKTLPFGTRVKVENLDDSTSTIVVINDRGPFVKGRVIDLSRAAAEDLGIVKKGVCNVKLTVIKDEEQTITPNKKIIEFAMLKDKINPVKRYYFNSVRKSK